MRTPAQQAASRANGARSRGPKTEEGKRRSATKPFSQDLLAKATVLKKESRQCFQELVRRHMLCIAPRNSVEEDAVEEICSATWRLYRLRAIERKAIDLELATQSSPDDLECLAHACGALPGKNPRPQNIIRRSLARIQALRQPGEKNLTKRTQRGTPRLSRPLGRPAGRTVRRSLYPCASGHTSRSHGLQPVNSKNLRLRHPTEKPRRTHRKPARTHPQPTRTHGKPAAGVPCPFTPRPPHRPAPRMLQSLVSVPI